MNKGVDEKIDDGVLRWFGHVERLENDRIAKRVYVGECVDSRSVGRPWKKWINAMKDCLKKRDLDVRQARRIVYDRSAWQGFVRGNIHGALTRCHSCEMTQPYEPHNLWA